MNFKTLFFCIGLALSVNADTIISFQPNTVARASEVNSNFALIVKRLDSLKLMATQLQTAESKIALLEKKCDSLSSTTNSKISSIQGSITKIDNIAKTCDTFEMKTKEIKDSLKLIGLLKSKCDSMDSKLVALHTTVGSHNTEISSINEKIVNCNKDIKTANDSLIVSEKRNYLPIGTIVASMYAPNNEGYMKNPDGSVDTKWVIAAGQPGIPDLRGMFLRGMNATRADGKQDPDGNSRVVGSYQEDVFKSHNHPVNLTSETYGLIRKTRTDDTKNTTVGDTDKDNVGTEPDVIAPPYPLPLEGGSETRPKNVAVYYYIKIK